MDYGLLAFNRKVVFAYFGEYYYIVAILGGLKATRMIGVGSDIIDIGDA